jgi:hypothetical protein
MVAACLKMCIFSVGKVRPKDWVRNRIRIRIWRQEIFGPWDIDERERLRKEDLLTLYHEQLQSVAAQEALATRKAEASRILTARGAGACVRVLQAAQIKCWTSVAGARTDPISP